MFAPNKLLRATRSLPRPTLAPHSLRWITTDAPPSPSAPRAPSSTTPPTPPPPRILNHSPLFPTSSDLRKHRQASTKEAKEDDPPLLPPLVQIRVGATFTHPSAVHTPQWRFEAPKLNQNGKRFRMEDYERYELLGKHILETTVLRLIFDSYTRLTPPVMEQLLTSLLSPTNLTNLSNHYALPSQLLADPQILPILRTSPRIAVSLFYSYLGSLTTQRSTATTILFLTSLFRPLVRPEYRRLKTIHHEKLRPKHEVAVSATDQLEKLCRERGEMFKWEFESDGGKPHEEKFVCTVVLEGGKKFVGKAMSGKQGAKNVACIPAVLYLTHLKSNPLQIPSTHTTLPYTFRLQSHCAKSRLLFTFKDKGLLPNEDTRGLHECVVVVKAGEKDEGIGARGRGVGKKLARNAAARACLLKMGLLDEEATEELGAKKE